MTGSDLLSSVPAIDPETSELYLSRLELNRRNRLVHQEIADSQAFHRRLLDAFPRLDGEQADAARAAHGILYRLDARRGEAGAVIALVQSVTAPDWSVLPPGYLHDEGWDAWAGGAEVAVKPTADRYRALQAGDAFRFRLRANPTRKIHIKPGTKGRNGQLLPVTRANGKREPLPFETLDERLRRQRGEADSERKTTMWWLQQKAAQHGFQVLDASDQPDPVGGKEQVGWKGMRPDRQRLTHAAVLFEGVLRITDADRFRATLWQGIGSGKAYGFGLLSIAPIARRG